MKKILISTLLMMLAFTAIGQEKNKYYIPKKGDWSIGVTFNPATLGRNISMQPKAGEFAGDWIEELASSPKQMFILSQDPLAAIRAKYYLSSKMAVRATLGFNGSLVNYKEYVRDDLASSIVFQAVVILRPNSWSAFSCNISTVFFAFSISSSLNGFSTI